jgi:hypothetical protein
MPTPFVMHAQLQGTFDSTLGRPEMLAPALCAPVLRELEYSDSGSDSDRDSDSDDVTEVLDVSTIVAMHIARRLRASASLSLGGVSRVTDARVFDAHTCRLLFRFSAPQVDELAHRMGLHACGTRVVSGHDVFDRVGTLVSDHARRAQRLHAPNGLRSAPRNAPPLWRSRGCPGSTRRAAATRPPSPAGQPG